MCVLQRDAKDVVACLSQKDEEALRREGGVGEHRQVTKETGEREA